MNDAEYQEWRNAQSASTTVQLREFLNESLVAGDVPRIVLDLDIIKSNCEYINDGLLAESLETLKNLQEPLRGQVFDELEKYVLHDIKFCAEHERKTPMSSWIKQYTQMSNFPDVLPVLFAQSSHQILLAFADVRKDSLNPLIKTYLEEIKGISADPEAFVVGVYAAAARAADKVEAAKRAAPKMAVAHAPKPKAP